MFPKVIELKVNAQVMLIKNLTTRDPSLVNGSLGIVTGFSEDTTEEGGDEVKGWGPNGQPAPSKPSRPRSSQLYPKVRFTSGVEILLIPEETTYEKNNVVVARRHQVSGFKDHT